MTKNLKIHHKTTASDVAKRAGVSKWTVSRAFIPGASVSDRAREKVLAAAGELGYRPNLLARSLSKKKTQIIGVVLDELKNPHSMMLLDEVTRQIQARSNMALVLNITPGENYHAVLSMADQLQVDGILFLATILTEELIAIARDMHHIPLVQVGRNNDTDEIDVVNNDGFHAGGEIAQLLLAQGYQRFGYMKGPDTSSGHLQRMDGYQARLQQAGSRIDVVLNAGHYDHKNGYRAMAEYLQSGAGLVDAIFCENDVLALGAIQALRQHGRQGQVGIVGFDNIDEAATDGWQLTTWNQGIERLINEALNRLIDNISAPEGDWREGEICIRQSHLKSK
ncbi:LacI family DNA-binding transcriptional regulator [Erwinia sorbitola]|uniref:Substrate-binding domain-containing protein n=1 Tax=Erwinia sorbitola TaxID=2681984 RepID=A0A6I6ENY9_9GAMM|nr:LacI family DNA-binding transcriptional regulator [Erwinia sorbitola]MTD27657.1 substrate-binding domain-containing protein [Erwinia sorbitola]QGU86332.1 substrate-binding domain-containing protein [Erwinia sorbitola]